MTKKRLREILLKQTKEPARTFRKPTGVTRSTPQDRIFDFIQKGFGCNREAVTKLVEMILKIKFPRERYLIPKPWSVNPRREYQAIVPWRKVPLSEDQFTPYKVGKVYVYAPEIDCGIGPMGYCMSKITPNSLKLFRVATPKEIRAFVKGLSGAAVKRFSGGKEG